MLVQGGVFWVEVDLSFTNTVRVGILRTRVRWRRPTLLSVDASPVLAGALVETLVPAV